MTCILFFRWGNKPENKVWWNRTKHPTRWDSMPHCYFSLPTIFLILQYDISFVFYFHWDDQIYVAHDMLGSLLQSLHDFYFYAIDTWALHTTYSYMYLVDKLYRIAVELFSRFISYLLKLSCTCMARDMLWYDWWNCVRGVPQEHAWYCWWICVRGVPPRSLMVLIGDGYNVERDVCMFHVEFINYSCRYMPLDAPWNFLQSVPLLWNVFKIVSVVKTSWNFFCD